MPDKSGILKACQHKYLQYTLLKEFTEGVGTKVIVHL